jgi:hypothetical protein
MNKNNSKVVVLNNQVTTVRVTTGVKKAKCRPKRRAPKIKKINGRIFQLCNDEPQVYFVSVRLRPAALIQIENKSACQMRAIVHLGNGRTVEQTVGREQQISIYVPSIARLAIQCTGEDNAVCRGYYALCLS